LNSVYGATQYFLPLKHTTPTLGWSRRFSSSDITATAAAAVQIDSLERMHQQLQQNWERTGRKKERKKS
jgi:hypothetical protein